MKKYFGITLAVLVVVALMGAAGVAYAQSTGPTPQPLQPGYQGGMMGGGRGAMMGNGGMMGRGVQAGGTPAGVPAFGVMHSEVIAAVAVKLGLGVDEINARLDKGETLYQIAESKGFTADQFTALMAEVHTSVTAQLLKDGKITQQQADRMQNMPMYGVNAADTDGDGQPDCPMLQGGGMRGMRGGRWNQQAAPSGTGS